MQFNVLRDVAFMFRKKMQQKCPHGFPEGREKNLINKTTFTVPLQWKNRDEVPSFHYKYMTIFAPAPQIS